MGFRIVARFIALDEIAIVAERGAMLVQLLHTSQWRVVARPEREAGTSSSKGVRFIGLASCFRSNPEGHKHPCGLVRADNFAFGADVLRGKIEGGTVRTLPRRGAICIPALCGCGDPAPMRTMIACGMGHALWAPAFPGADALWQVGEVCPGMGLSGILAIIMR